jgi:hypothetical protein
VSYAPLVRDGQHFVGKPDVAPCRWQIRPIRADRFSAPQRLIKRCLPIGPVLTEEGGGRVGVPRLPRAREALKPGIEPVVIALRRQSARTVAQSGDPVAARDRATVSDVLSASALERLKRVAVAQRQSQCDTEIQAPSSPHARERAPASIQSQCCLAWEGASRGRRSYHARSDGRRCRP